MEIGFEEVKALLPQKFPFLMVDKILEWEKGKRAVSLKNITGNEIWFLGHFPNRAVLPGALLIEGMAQTAILLFRKSFEGELKEATDPDTLFFFGSAKVRFLRPVVPGEQLLIEVNVVKVISSGGIVDAVARVDGQIVAKAQLGFGVKP